MTFTAYVTQDVLKKGIQRVNATPIGKTMIFYIDSSGDGHYCHELNWFMDEFHALGRANEIKRNEMQKLRKYIAAKKNMSAEARYSSLVNLDF